MHKSFGIALRWLVALTVLLAGLWLPPVGAQSAEPSPQRKTSTPYTGDLSIFDVPGRDQRLQINRVMEMLGIEPGRSVADIGAGSGWFTVRAARRLASSGTVYAVDINPDAIQYIEQRAKKEQLRNIKTILSKPDDPHLPADSVDAVLLLKTYHEIAHPIALLSNLRLSLKPGAKIGIIDRNGNGEDHGVGKDVVIREAAQAGFELRYANPLRRKYRRADHRNRSGHRDRIHVGYCRFRGAVSTNLHQGGRVWISSGVREGFLR